MKPFKPSHILSFAFAVLFMVFALLPAPLIADAASSSSTQAKIDALDEKIAEAEAQIAENEAKKDAVADDAESLQAEVDAYQEQIDSYNEKISLLNQSISELNSSISSLESEISEIQAKIDEQQESIGAIQEVLGQRLRATYLAGNVTNLELLLEADSFATLLNRIELIARIGENDSAIISELKEKMAVIQEEQNELKDKEAEMQADKQSLQSSKTELEDSKQEIVDKKSALDTKVNSLNSYISGLDEESEELEQYIAQAHAQQQAFVNSLNNTVSSGGSTGSGSANGGSMTWPVPYSGSYISSGYGYRSLGSSSSFHYGIDITMAGADSYDKIVVAADSGTVYISNNKCSHNYRKSYNCGCNGGYGNYIVIDNGDGLHIYYGHLARATVSAGEHVEEGQTIGILGCSGYSTGPHLHFEIRVNDGSSRSAAARNPLNYVSAP